MKIAQIDERIQTIKRILKTTYIKCVSTDIEELNVMFKSIYGKDNKTKIPITNYFLSYKSFKPVANQSLTRCLKVTLMLAGINSEQFTAHSYRGAGLSSAYNKRATQH